MPLPILYALLGAAGWEAVTGNISELIHGDQEGPLDSTATIIKWVVIGGAIYLAWKTWGRR